MRNVSPVHDYSASQLIAALEGFDGACDPEFDSGFEELERQFAEFRLTFEHNWEGAPMAKTSANRPARRSA